MSVSSEQQEKPGLFYYLGIALRGFSMGAADVVPGVSGGTIALLTGIYNDLLDAISAFNLAFLRKLFSPRWREALNEFPWKFLLALGLGIGTAIFSLARFLKWALAEHPAFLWSFFFGLVLATVLVVSRRIEKPGLHTVGTTLLTAAGAYLLLGMTPAETPEAAWFLFISGMLAVCAMILPGISGAFILVLLGKYEFVLDAVVRMDVFSLLLIAAGGVVGLMSLARLLRWLLHNYYDVTIAALTGFMMGSMRKLWPWKVVIEDPELAAVRVTNVLPDAFSQDILIAVFLMLVGFTIVMLVEILPKQRRAVQTAEE